MGEAAKELGCPKNCLEDWKLRHAELWSAAYDAAMVGFRDAVRSIAGTDAATDNAYAFLRMAGRVDKWSAERGEVLFPTADTTLESFFEEYYLPVCMGKPKPMTVYVFRGILRRWSLLMGNPPLKAITNQMLAVYRDAMCSMVGIDRIKPLSPNTVRDRQEKIQRLLDKAGPPGPRNRDAADLLARPPYCKPVRELIRPPVTVPIDRIGETYAAAVAAEVPRFPGIKPPAWWRALLVVAYNTGLRRGALMSLPMKAIDWQRRLIDVPGEWSKTQTGQVLPLTDVAYEHLLAIRTDRRLVFEWPHCYRYFELCFYKIQAAAGIQPADQFGLQEVRRTVSTQLFETNAGAATLLLGHGSSTTTRKWYVGAQGILTRALASMPQPAAFGQIGGAA